MDGRVVYCSRLWNVPAVTVATLRGNVERIHTRRLQRSSLTSSPTKSNRVLNSLQTSTDSLYSAQLAVKHVSKRCRVYWPETRRAPLELSSWTAASTLHRNSVCLPGRSPAVSSVRLPVASTTTTHSVPKTFTPTALTVLKAEYELVAMWCTSTTL